MGALQTPEIAPRRPSSGWSAANAAAYAQIIIAMGVVLAICYVAQKVLIALLIAVLVAVMLEPIVSLLRRIGIPRPVGAFLAVTLTVAACYGAASVSYSRGTVFLANLPKYTSEVRQTVLRFRRQAQQFQRTTDAMLANPTGASRPVAVYPSLTWSDAITRIVGPLTEFLLFLSSIPFLVYFMLTWKDHTNAATVRLFHVDNRVAAVGAMGEIAQMIRAFIAGNLFIGLFIGVFSTVVFGIVGLPSFAAVGFISGFVSLVPYLGVVLAMVPPLLVGIGEISRAQVGVIAATAAGLHVLAFSVLYPKLLGPRLELNPLAVTIALLVWGWLWGGLGLIFALPLTAVIKIVCDHIAALQPLGDWMGESSASADFATSRSTNVERLLR
jgi:predicted PurR-regulated permease PerM